MWISGAKWSEMERRVSALEKQSSVLAETNVAQLERLIAQTNILIDVHDITQIDMHDITQQFIEKLLK